MHPMRVLVRHQPPAPDDPRNADRSPRRTASRPEEVAPVAPQEPTHAFQTRDLATLSSMQATAGNAAVARLIAQRQLGPGPGPAGAKSPPGPAPAVGPAPATGSTPTTPAAADRVKLDPAKELEANLARIEAEFDEKIKTHPHFKSTAQRTQFLKYEREFFGSDTATIDHFAKIKQVAIPGEATWMHEEASNRLLSVAKEMGKRMPQSDGNGWWFRTGFGTGGQDVSDFHKVGLAIDYNAAETPHLGARGKEIDPRQTDLITIITGRYPQMNFKDDAAMLLQLRKMGEASLLTDEAERDKVLKSKESTDLLATIRSEAEALEKASATFQDSLAGNGATLTQLQKDYFATDDAAKKDAIFKQVPALVATWMTTLDAQLKKMSDDIDGLGDKVATLPAGAALIAATASTKSSADGVERALKGLKPPPPKAMKAAQRKEGPKRAAPRDPVADAGRTIDAARATLGEGAWTPPTPAADADAAAELKAAVLTELERLAARLTNRGLALGKKSWHDRVLAVKTGLTDDVAFVFGRPADRDKHKPQIEAGNPPVAQLLGRGFYNTTGRSKSPGAFDIDFVEAMSRYGFALGARYAHPDSMHFELFWKGGK